VAWVDCDFACGLVCLVVILGLDGVMDGVVIGGVCLVLFVWLLLVDGVFGLVFIGFCVGVSGVGGDGVFYLWWFWLDDELIVLLYWFGVLCSNFVCCIVG